LQIDDLFMKIGILTVENDMLRAQLNAAAERIHELEQSAQEQQETAKPAVNQEK
jgi:hypothetical protein